MRPFIHRSYQGDRLTLLFLALALLFHIAIWLLLFFAIKPTSDQIILHYHALYGPDLYSSWDTVFRIPLAGLFILALNIMLAFLFFRKEKLASHFLMATAFAIQIFLFITSLTIMYINKT